MILKNDTQESKKKNKNMVKTFRRQQNQTQMLELSEKNFKMTTLWLQSVHLDNPGKSHPPFKNANLITLTKSLLPSKETYLQVPEVRMESQSGAGEALFCLLYPDFKILGKLFL